MMTNEINQNLKAKEKIKCIITDTIKRRWEIRWIIKNLIWIIVFPIIWIWAKFKLRLEF